MGGCTQRHGKRANSKIDYPDRHGHLVAALMQKPQRAQHETPEARIRRLPAVRGMACQQGRHHSQDVRRAADGAALALLLGGEQRTQRRDVRSSNGLCGSGPASILGSLSADAHVV